MSRHMMVHSVLRLFGVPMATLLGAPIAAFSIGAALIVCLPMSEKLSFAIGTQSMIPLWVALACALPMCRSGRRAWLWCLLFSLPLLVVLALRAWL